MGGFLWEFHCVRQWSFIEDEGSEDEMKGACDGVMKRLGGSISVVVSDGL